MLLFQHSLVNAVLVVRGLLSAGLTRFPSLTLLTTQRLCRVDGHGCGHSDEDTESLAYGHSIGGSSEVSGGGSPAFSSLHNIRQHACLLYTSPSPRDRQKSRMPSSA